MPQIAQAPPTPPRNLKPLNRGFEASTPVFLSLASHTQASLYLKDASPSRPTEAVLIFFLSRDTSQTITDTSSE